MAAADMTKCALACEIGLPASNDRRIRVANHLRPAAKERKWPRTKTASATGGS